MQLHCKVWVAENLTMRSSVLVLPWVMFSTTQTLSIAKTNHRQNLDKVGKDNLSRSVNPISTRGEQIMPAPNNTGTPRFSALTTVLQLGMYCKLLQLFFAICFWQSWLCWLRHENMNNWKSISYFLKTLLSTNVCVEKSLVFSLTKSSYIFEKAWTF